MGGEREGVKRSSKRKINTRMTEKERVKTS